MGLEEEGLMWGVFCIMRKELKRGQTCWGTSSEDLPALILSSSEFGAPVSIPVQEILDFICRTLSISAKNIVSGACPLFTVLRTQGNQESGVRSEAPQMISSLRWSGQRLASTRLPLFLVLLPTHAQSGVRGLL